MEAFLKGKNTLSIMTACGGSSSGNSGGGGDGTVVVVVVVGVFLL